MSRSSSPPAPIYITRHGFSEHNALTSLYMGRSPDASLTEEGRAQARALGERLQRESSLLRIVSSSLPRTMETARIVAKATGVTELAEEDAFWELSKGDWEGRMPRELPPKIAQEVAADPYGFCYGGGESYRDVEARVAPAFQRWVEECKGSPVLFVLHGDVIRALLHHILQFPAGKIGDFSIEPCSLTEVHQSPSGYHVVRINDASHLP